MTSLWPSNGGMKNVIDYPGKGSEKRARALNGGEFPAEDINPNKVLLFYLRGLACVF